MAMQFLPCKRGHISTESFHYSDVSSNVPIASCVLQILPSIYQQLVSTAAVCIGGTHHTAESKIGIRHGEVEARERESYVSYGKGENYDSITFSGSFFFFRGDTIQGRHFRPK